MKNTGTTVFTLRTVTLAERARRLLADRSIGARIVRLDPALSPRGCAFGIEVESGQRENVARILDAYSLPYGGGGR